MPTSNPFISTLDTAGIGTSHSQELSRSWGILTAAGAGMDPGTGICVGPITGPGKGPGMGQGRGLRAEGPSLALALT